MLSQTRIHPPAAPACRRRSRRRRGQMVACNTDRSARDYPSRLTALRVSGLQAERLGCTRYPNPKATPAPLPNRRCRSHPRPTWAARGRTVNVSLPSLIIVVAAVPLLTVAVVQNSPTARCKATQDPRREGRRVLWSQTKRISHSRPKGRCQGHLNRRPGIRSMPPHTPASLSQCSCPCSRS